MSRLVQLLRSVRFALAVLVSLGTYTFVCSWLPWVRDDGAAAPGWAKVTGLDHPFASAPFLLGCVCLFASTWACTWGRRARIAAISRGQLPATAAVLTAQPGRDVRALLLAEGFRGEGPVLRRFAPALWGGWIFHVGLLVLIAAVVVQQAFHDGGAFELADGEVANLRTTGVVLGRRHGPLSPEAPPDLEVGLLAFDPYTHQSGYAADRLSRLRVKPSGEAAREVTLDRAAGVTAGPVELFQAIPTGLALVVEVAGQQRAIHLRTDRPQRAAAFVTSPAGREVHFAISSERPLADPQGTGALTIRRTVDGDGVTIEPGASFDFGGTPARLVTVTRWAGFTWSRSPGVPGVFLGFAFILLGALLLAFPAAIARLEAPGNAAAAHVSGRGTELLVAQWRREVEQTPP